MNKVLFVDDEPNILDGYRRNLRKQFAISIASSGQEGLELIDQEGPFAVIVSDMRMPQMDGVEFLSKAKQSAPDTVRMMLTGNADQQTAVDAVNEGDVFRFLNKPCPPPDMAKALEAACKQYQLMAIERELLENTLKGSINAMTEVLALSNPEAFGRTSRLKDYMLKTAQALNLQELWEVETTAMLCLLGYTSLPTELINNLISNKELSEAEMALFSKHPQAGANLIANIPRMEGIAASIKYQEQWFDGTGIPGDGTQGDKLPIGARILKVILDYDRYDSNGVAPEISLARLSSDARRYDPKVVEAFTSSMDTGAVSKVVRISITQLIEGMTLAEDVRTEQGSLLVCKGQEITASVSERLVNFWHNGAIAEKVSVYPKEN